MLARFFFKLRGHFLFFSGSFFILSWGGYFFYSPAAHPINTPYSPIFIDSGRPIYLTIATGHDSFSKPFLCLPNIIALIKVKRLLRLFKSLTEGILFYHIFTANFASYFHIFTMKKREVFYTSLIFI